MSISKITLTQDQINEITNHINSFRFRHHSKLITYNKDINNFSQLYAEKLALTNTFKHSGNKLYGENLSYFRGYKNDLVSLVKKSIDNWYSEIKLYNFNDPKFSSGTGHFTCLIWDSSINFGIGYAYNTTNRTAIVVLNTSPPGNISGLYRENVFPI